MYSGPPSCILNMQPKTLLASAFFIADDLRGEVMQRNEIANMMDVSGGSGTTIRVWFARRLRLSARAFVLQVCPRRSRTTTTRCIRWRRPRRSCRRSPRRPRTGPSTAPPAPNIACADCTVSITLSPSRCIESDINRSEPLTSVLAGVQVQSAKCMTIVDQWKKVEHSNVVHLKEIFTTKNFNDRCKCARTTCSGTSATKRSNQQRVRFGSLQPWC